ncbi:MAG: nucleotidyltransferase family protein [Opitutaceae bacterium]|jgi:molybdenum cofactor cytidylyltransferase|nr:nucleotidyltransferase family protein [Opitutaceae bacterium]
MNTAAILLAAGAASRWGGDEPKALLAWQGDRLIGHLARAALAAGAGPVVRVLGARAELIQERAPAPPGVLDVFNADWSSGMGGSIACGLAAALEARPELAAVLILPCDQPLVTAAVLAECLAAQGGRERAIVQCDYGGGSYGPPVVFGRGFFPELLALTGDEGGRAVVRRHPEALARVVFPGGKWDIDSPEDLTRFKSETNPITPARPCRLPCK